MSDFKIYVASRASVPERSAMWRNLKNAGCPINSSWIFEAGEGETESLGKLWQRIQKEVTEAYGLILYVGAEDFPLKGALIEVGMALAQDKPVVVVQVGCDFPHPSYRPIGSWIKHPNVTVMNCVGAAYRYLVSRYRGQP